MPHARPRHLRTVTPPPPPGPFPPWLPELLGVKRARAALARATSPRSRMSSAERRTSARLTLEALVCARFPKLIAAAIGTSLPVQHSPCVCGVPALFDDCNRAIRTIFLERIAQGSAYRIGVALSAPMTWHDTALLVQVPIPDDRIGGPTGFDAFVQRINREPDLHFSAMRLDDDCAWRFPDDPTLRIALLHPRKIIS